MGTSVLQPSFAAGELSPSLYARVDLARYQIGLKTCRNFVVMAQGGVRNRAGTRFVDITQGNTKCRLIRFKFSVDDACVLVFGENTMRVVRNGAFVLSGGLPYQILTPWPLADLDRLNYTQSADVMTFVHTSYRPRELKRFANDNWTITEPAYVPTIAAPASATATAAVGTGATQSWTYQVTAVFDDANSIEESLPVTSNAVTVWNSDGYTATIVWPAVVGATYYNVYKDRSGAGVYQFTGRATTTTLTDRNILPTVGDGPPTGLDPFVGAGNYPGAVGYYQQRKVYGGTINRPQTSWFSRAGVFNNFGYATPQKDDDAITWTMASNEVNRIMNYLPLRQLITLTTGAEWSIQGGASGFTSKTINGDPQSYNGSGYVRPVVLNDTAMYLQNNGRSVYGLNYSLESDGLSSDDLTIWSKHLLRDFGITDWSYQGRNNESVVWGVRGDGAFLGLTYLRKQDVIAWHRHDTDGVVESICSVPEGSDDVVYMVVKRTTAAGVVNHCIESMQSREIPYLPNTYDRDVTMGFFVDSGLTYNGRAPSNQIAVLTTPSPLPGDAPWMYPEPLSMTLNGAYLSGADVGKTIIITSSDGESIRLLVTGVPSTSIALVTPQSMVPVSLRAIPAARWARASKTFSGLSHLEGKEVSILADGNVCPRQVVTGGAVTIEDPSGIVHIGLPYVSDAETLRINMSGQETLNDKNKTVTSVTVIVDESRGIFAGSDGDNLFEYKQREFEDYNDPVDLLSGMAEIQISNTWDNEGQVLIRQTDPLPLTILGIIPNLTVAGGK